MKTFKYTYTITGTKEADCEEDVLDELQQEGVCGIIAVAEVIEGSIRFQYEAMNNTGEYAKGEVEANSENDARRIVKDKGLYITKFEKVEMVAETKPVIKTSPDGPYVYKIALLSIGVGLAAFFVGPSIISNADDYPDKVAGFALLSAAVTFFVLSVKK